MIRTHILVVDDDDDLRETLRDVLEVEHDVTTAPDATTALALIERHTFDLLLVDVHMPGLDGPALARELRRRGSQVPIVASSSGPRLEQHARQMGARAWIAKPCDVEELLEVVRMHATCAA